MVPFWWVLLPPWTREQIGRGPLLQHAPLKLGNLGFWGCSFGLLVCWARDYGSRNPLCLLGGGGHTDAEESGWVRAPWGGHTSPQPLILPQHIPFVGGLQPPGDLPQVTGRLPPILEIGSMQLVHPLKKIEKRKERSGSPKMVRARTEKWSTKQNKRERGLTDQGAFEPCSLLMQVHTLLHPGVGPVKLSLL